MKAMVLAAGLGERLKPLTEKIPKPMLEINKKPILYYISKLLAKYKVEEVVINLNYKPEAIKNYLGNKKFGIRVNYSLEKKLLGTAGGVKKAQVFFQDDFFVIYGDIITDINLNEVRNFHDKMKGIATLCLHKSSHNVKSSSLVELDKNNRIVRFIENPQNINLNAIKGFKLVNSGIYIFKTKIFDYIPEHKFTDFAINIFPNLLEKEKVYGFVHEKCYWAEIGRLDKYYKIKHDIENNNKLNL